MKKQCIILIILTGVFFNAFSTFAQNWGEIRYVHGPTHIRADRSVQSEVVGLLTTSQKVRADFFKDKWSAVFDLEVTVRNENKAMGYVYAPLLKADPPRTPKTAEEQPTALKYDIVEVEQQEIEGCETPRMAYRVIVDTDETPSENQLTQIATELWKNGNTKWKEFVVFMYLPEMDTHSYAFSIVEFKNRQLEAFRVLDMF